MITIGNNNKLKFKVFIPAAGLGSRLGDETKLLNKSLVSLEHKPIISHIFDKIHPSVEIVIALGYKGKLLKDFINVTYGNTRKISFIKVDDYKSKNASLRYTILKSKKFLQCPFIFIACDSIIYENLKIQNNDWIGVSNKNKQKYLYRKVILRNNKIEFREKSNKSGKIYTGICGIINYKKFWEGFKNNSNYSGEIAGLVNLDLNKKSLKEILWDDGGNLNNLKILRSKCSSNINILDKENEKIWFVNNKVIKYSDDTKFIKNRIIRAKRLKDIVPNIIRYRKNFYCYSFIKGDVFSKIVDKNKFLKLINFFNRRLWIQKKISIKERKLFHNSCKYFYKVKTQKRINLFFENFGINDSSEIINGVNIESVKNLLTKIDWNYLSNGIPSRIHGDLHFENIISDKKKIYLIDWRQDFAGNIEYGDLYYDLAKIYHGLIVSHEEVIKENYTIDISKNVIFFEIKIKKLYKDLNVIFDDFLSNNFDLHKTKILTALIFLNIAPLHHKPYCYLLFYLGKEMLHNSVYSHENL